MVLEVASDVRHARQEYGLRTASEGTGPVPVEEVYDQLGGFRVGHVGVPVLRHDVAQSVCKPAELFVVVHAGERKLHLLSRRWVAGPARGLAADPGADTGRRPGPPSQSG